MKIDVETINMGHSSWAYMFQWRWPRKYEYRNIGIQSSDTRSHIDLLKTISSSLTISLPPPLYLLIFSFSNKLPCLAKISIVFFPKHVSRFIENISQFLMDRIHSELKCTKTEAGNSERHTHTHKAQVDMIMLRMCVFLLWYLLFCCYYQRAIAATPYIHYTRYN